MSKCWSRTLQAVQKGKLVSVLPLAPRHLGPSLIQSTARAARVCAAQAHVCKAKPVIYCLGGVPGSGKTRLRMLNPTLRDAPVVDIGDKYASGAKDYKEAADMFFAEAEDLLKAGHEKIVLEAFFSDRQRLLARLLATRYKAQVQWIWCFAPRKVCHERVRAQAQQDSPARQQARLRMVQDLPGHFFEARPGEYPPYS